MMVNHQTIVSRRTKLFKSTSGSPTWLSSSSQTLMAPSRTTTSPLPRYSALWSILSSLCRRRYLSRSSKAITYCSIKKSSRRTSMTKKGWRLLARKWFVEISAPDIYWMTWEASAKISSRSSARCSTERQCCSKYMEAKEMWSSCTRDSIRWQGSWRSSARWRPLQMIGTSRPWCSRAPSSGR